LFHLWILNLETLCACPTSPQFRPTSSRKKRNQVCPVMVACLRLVVVKVLSQIEVRIGDSAERVRVLELLRAGCRWRLWGRFERIPPKSWRRATSRRKAAMGGLLLMFVINHLYSGGLVYWTLGWTAHPSCPRVSVETLFRWRGWVSSTGYATGRRGRPKNSSTCICATFLSFMCDCP